MYNTYKDLNLAEVATQYDEIKLILNIRNSHPVICCPLQTKKRKPQIKANRKENLYSKSYNFNFFLV